MLVRLPQSSNSGLSRVIAGVLSAALTMHRAEYICERSKGDNSVCYQHLFPAHVNIWAHLVIIDIQNCVSA